MPQPARNQFNNVIFDNFSYICKKITVLQVFCELKPLNLTILFV